MKLIWLLGAGASVDAGLPDAHQLTEKLLAQAASGDSMAERGGVYRMELLRFLAGAIIFRAAERGADPTKFRVNVEALFNAVKFLADRNEWEFLPLVGAFHPKIVEIASAKTDPRSKQRRAVQDFESALSNLLTMNVRGTTQRPKLEIAMRPGAKKTLLSSLLAMTAEGDDLNVFERTLDWMVSALTDSLIVDPDTDLSYVKPMLSGNPDHIIATLNYDLVVENAAREFGVMAATGIEGWQPGVYELSRARQPLLKLHGSINWVYPSDGVKSNRYRVHEINEFDTEDDRERVLIFGGANKLTSKGPFIDLLLTFQKKLMEAEALVIVGYSFADEHINDQIEMWFNAKPGPLFVVNGPGFDPAKLFRTTAGISRLPFRHIEESAADVELRKRFHIIGEYARDGIARAAFELGNART